MVTLCLTHCQNSHQLRGVASSGDNSCVSCFVQAAADIVPFVMSELRRRWPCLGRVPDSALVQLLQELPAVFRVAWASQQQQQQMQQHKHSQPTNNSAGVDAAGAAFVRLPQALLDVLFKGVDALLPAPQPSSQHQQPRHELSPDSLGSCSSSTSSPAQANWRNAGDVEFSLSGCLWEPLSEAELAAGVDRMRIAGLVSINSPSTSSNTSNTSLGVPVCGVVLQQLQFAADAAGEHSSHAKAFDAEHPTATAVGGCAGVTWEFNSCPASMLKALVDAASQALKRELATAVEAAGTVPVG